MPSYIGITIANYYPRVDLNASAGVAALSSADLFEKSSRIWTIGPEINIPLFPSGRRKNDTARAKAAYLEALELYRKAVLSAFQDVENALSGIHNLDRALVAQKKIHHRQPRGCSPNPAPLQSRSCKLLRSHRRRAPATYRTTSSRSDPLKQTASHCSTNSGPWRRLDCSIKLFIK